MKDLKTFSLIFLILCCMPVISFAVFQGGTLLFAFMGFLNATFGKVSLYILLAAFIFLLAGVLTAFVEQEGEE